ncbi:MAG: hypothetical protein ACTHLK_03280 [Brucella intermedia]
MNIHPKHRYKQRNPRRPAYAAAISGIYQFAPLRKTKQAPSAPYVSHATNSQKFQKLLKIEQMTLHCRQLFMKAGCGFNDGSAMHKEKIGC